MAIRILLATVVLFFSFLSIRAQDSLKHVVKHAHKTHLSDSTKVLQSSHKYYLKDTTKVPKKHSIVMPKYPRDGYVAIMGGTGLPVGGYASGGCASNGTVLSISAGFPGIVSHCGIAFKFDHGTNSLNQNQYLNTLTNLINVPDINYWFTGTVEKFSYTTLLAGLYLTYPSERFSIGGRILGGVMMATYPSFAVSVYDQANGNAGTIYQSEVMGSSFAIDFGIEMRYHVKPKLSIMLSIDYLHAVPSFTDVVTGVALSSNGALLQEYGEGPASQAYSLFNFSVGVGYTIYAKRKAN